jgi:U3 small nucleolar RNA-associated protein 21
LFPSPILSLAISLSGEYLAVSQIGKEGIFLYVDRSLYETVYFNVEPQEPTPVGDSLVRAEDEPESAEVEGEDVSPHTNTEDFIAPTQAQVVVADHDIGDSLSMKGAIGKIGKNEINDLGCITLSSVPKAYWTSLFRLEAIKDRNKCVFFIIYTIYCNVYANYHIYIYIYIYLYLFIMNGLQITKAATAAFETAIRSVFPPDCSTR